MIAAIEVSDSLSNTEEQIERAAKTIGNGQFRPKIFAAVYHHKKRVKSVSEVMARSGIVSRMRVLQEARHLVRKGVIRPATKNGETAYEMIGFFHAHKRQILTLAANRSKLAELPTKRKTSATIHVKQQLCRSRPKAILVSLDEIDSFCAARRLKPNGFMPRQIDEERFKRGIQRILAEPGAWKDWGGEHFDLASTRLLLRGRRVSTVFAFKGWRGRPLVPAMMGKNADQIPRMFFADARAFFVQYHEEIKPSIVQLLRTCALEKSDALGEPVFYGVIDGVDSNRVLRAHPTKFTAT